MKRIILLLLTSILIVSCGDNQKPISNAESKDTVVKHQVQTTKVPEYQADYFYVVDENSDIFVGNSPDDLQITEVNGFDAVISPNGKYLVYTALIANRRSIYSYNIDKKESRLLNLPPDNEAYMGSYSPDSCFIAANFFTNNYHWNIALYDLKKDTFKLIGKEKNCDYFSPTFSPDCKYLVFHDMEKLYVYDFKGFASKFNKTIACENFCTQNDMGISSNNKFQIMSGEQYIVFTYDYFSQERLETTVLAYYDVETGEITELSNKKTNTCLDFAVSHDGLIYFLLSNNDNPDEAQLYVAKTDGQKPAKVSSHIFQTPCSFSIAN